MTFGKGLSSSVFEGLESSLALGMRVSCSVSALVSLHVIKKLSVLPLPFSLVLRQWLKSQVANLLSDLVSDLVI